MKKILFAIAIVLTLGLTANAQGKNDAFVTDCSSAVRASRVGASVASRALVARRRAPVRAR